MTYNKFINYFIKTTSLYDFIFAYAVLNAYFEFQGLSIMTITILLSFWALSATILEIPSGALADRFDYRHMMIIAPLIKSFTFIIWGFSDGSVIMYAVGYFLWALASTLRSGTEEAYLYTGLKDYNKEVDFEKIIGKMRFYKNIAIGSSMIIGGFIAALNLKAVMYTSFVPLLYVAYTAYKLPTYNSSSDDNSYFTHLKNARNALFHNKKLQMILLYSLLISTFGDLEELDQLYFTFIGIPVWQLGLISATFYMVSSYTMTHAYRLKKRRHVYIIMPSIALVSVLITAYTQNILGIISLIIAYGVISPLSVLVDGEIQDSIENESRATVTSLNGLFINLFGVILSPILGYLSHLFNITVIYKVTAVLMIPLIYIGTRKKDDH